MPRPDVRAAVGLPGAGLSGFSLALDLGRWPGADGEHRVEAVATSVAGERLELEAAIAVSPATPPPAAPALPRASGRSGRGRRVLVCHHQLCLGGASRYLLELLGELVAQGAVDPVVLSPIGGPLRERLEALGIPVHVSGPTPIDELDAVEGRAEEIAAWAAPQGFELALVNTASPLNLCAAEAAARLGLPTLWTIHESFEPAVLWADCGPAVERRLRMRLEGAAQAVFVAEATARLFEPLVGDRSTTLPYGFDFAEIDALRADFDRTAVRRGLGVPADAELVLCVGTVEPRKAQAQLAQAFDLIAARHPRARLALVGATAAADSQELAHWLASSASAGRVELVPTTPAVQRWYGVADLLVCPARIESLPRAAVEAMAWGLPVLATDVFGLPELIAHGETGWLCPAGDTLLLAEALDRALSAPAEEKRRIGSAGRELVERRHALTPYGREIARLLESAASSAGKPVG